MNFKEALQTNMLVGDGAMGTYLYEAGYTGSFEALNLTEPAVIKKVHREYVESGADVIQTNTYRANRVMLQKYEIEEKVEAINQAAVRIAKEAVGRDAYVVGTIGGIKGVQPIDVSDTEIEKALVEQAKALLSEHPDGLLFETFYDIEELTAAIRNVRQFSDTVIIAQVALEEVGVMKGGLTVQDVFEQLKEAGADVVGLNCGMGPYHIHRSFESVPLMEEVYFSAYPNASLPELEEGRFVYQSNPDYFYEKAGDLKKQGVRLIGGCCGTTPAHIREIARALKGTTPIKEKTFVVSMEEPMEWKEKEPALPLNDTSPKTKIIVELDPPKKLDVTRFMKGVTALKEAGADAVTMADNSLASPRIDNLAMGALVKQQTNARPLLHVTCRDRNLIGLQSHLLGIHALGIHDVLAVTGDPTKVGDFPGAASVYDLNSFRLISLLKEMNEGRSYTGKSLGEKTSFTVAAAFNPNVRNLNLAVKRMEKKIDAGADYFMSQPVYDLNHFQVVYEATKHLKTPIYIGIMPLVSSRNAEFLHNEVPGITLTDEVRKRMAMAGEDRQLAEKEGLEIAKSLIDEALKYFHGIYLITPFLRYEMTATLTKYIRQTVQSKQR
ncbi:bifunctional homocysteine S-methyltransferase/methylenetetrahydrofolate reductase [Aliibacillus thermotolerans]|uniref:Bifunctional homocysteine S-methyltransferase/methylenetetrahydrofolate reductase n=1 Tax=Aliibacillus thermotolerans TaxID=1834418 RepID=A0ABW0U5T4_9BACI|nr:bifunctional homocysteine S-methyltransferase/methylenetetrahydrofolate reductase [Aliibacillus thermotolerans]MDA3129485.1 bifunctional homocysteine S-methyltransferase/methylenetetrahydrofolate reductase [Aliibacillus thermotolerans]